jgi:ferredoxin-NADP reductase
MMSRKFFGTKPHRVTGIDEIAPGVFVLSFERLFEFIPGQVVALSLEKDDPSPRIYSICSGKDEPVISVLFIVVPGGRLTTSLANLKTGDTLFCSAPHGSFYGDGSPAYWIASGTGIAPYISMLKSGLGGNKLLIHGGRHIESFYFQDELLKEMPGRYIRCSSKEKGENIYEGRLTNWLKEQESLDSAGKFYLCGSAEMVVEARDIIIEKGISFNNIFSEIYF